MLQARLHDTATDLDHCSIMPFGTKLPRRCESLEMLSMAFVKVRFLKNPLHLACCFEIVYSKLQPWLI
uniref:Uncharacterized protein n=1 Tax=Kalanchoe fedtschenkoi TaxID=63787 RepID=A0A7N0U6G5_KALFE